MARAEGLRLSRHWRGSGRGEGGKEGEGNRLSSSSRKVYMRNKTQGETTVETPLSHAGTGELPLWLAWVIAGHSPPGTSWQPAGPNWCLDSRVLRAWYCVSPHLVETAEHAVPREPRRCLCDSSAPSPSGALQSICSPS